MNEPKTLAGLLMGRDYDNSPDDTCPSQAAQAALSRSIALDWEHKREDFKPFVWAAWRAAWNQRGSMDTMDSLEERTARTAFEQWWEKDA